MMAGPQDDRTSVGSIDIIIGEDTPEGVVDGPQGSLYIRTNGASANEHLYLKSSPLGTLTGWRGVVTV